MVVQDRTFAETHKAQATGEFLVYIYHLQEGDLYLFPRSRYVDSLFLMKESVKDTSFFETHARFIRFENPVNANNYIYENT